MQITVSLPLPGSSRLSRFRPIPNLTSLNYHPPPPPKNICCLGSSISRRNTVSSTLLRCNLRQNSFKARAASIPESTSQSESQVGAVKILQLAAMFGIWYLLNIHFNILNKQILKVFPFPATVSAIQFGCGTSMILTIWALNLHPRPQLTRSKLAAILPLAVAHAVGNLLTNISLGKVAVSFTHTIKAMEPFFTVVFASLFLGEKPSVWVVSSLAPVVGGVALASCTEVSFNWTGFCTAMASNVTNQSRNVLSKKFMVDDEDTLDNINLFSVMTVTAFLLLVPTALLMEGFKFGPSYLEYATSKGLNVRELIIRCLVSGFCFHSYQQVSYMILGMVNAVTHAVGNSVKRVVLIVASVVIFRTPVSPINALGTATALTGVFLYSRAKGIKPDLKAS